MTDALGELLRGIAQGQAAVRRATAWVEWEADDKDPNRTNYRISGQTAETVQHAIDARMRETEAAPGGGCATFTNPKRGAEGKFWSNGYVIKWPANAGEGEV